MNRLQAVQVNAGALYTAFEFAAVLASAVSGVIEARQRRLDAVGTFVVAFLAAFGGGTLRDVLLDRRPFYWVAHEWMVWAVFLLTLSAPWLLRFSSGNVSARALIIFDAIGLGIFSAAGTQLAIAMGLPPFTAVMMGVITAVCGGLLRDIVCNEMPMILRDGRPYATCAFVGNWALLGLLAVGVAESAAVTLAAVLIFALRMLSLRMGVELPR